jgi:hypothetical protein
MARAYLLLAIVLLIPVFGGCLGSDSAGTAQGVKGRGGHAKAGAGLNAPVNFVASLPDGTILDPSLLSGLAPLDGEQRFIGHRTFEPTLGVDPKGNVYMVAFGGGATVRGSFDQGATWKQVNPALLPVNNPVSNQPVNNPPNSNDPYVYVDKVTGRIYQSDLQALVCSWLIWSDDMGNTWTTNPAGCGLPPGVHDHQSLAAGKSRGTPSTWANRILYYCVNRVGDSSCSTSLNGGLTFGPLIPVLPGLDVEAGRPCGGLTGHVKTDNVGRAFLGKNQCGVPSVGVSEDDGKTWTIYKISRALGVRGHDVEIAADDKDNLYAFWISDGGMPVLSMSKDHGKTWTAPINVVAPGVTATTFGAITAGAEGKIAFTYMGTTIENGYAKKPPCVSRGVGPTAPPPDCTAHDAAWANATWNSYIGVITNALDERPMILTTTANDPMHPVAIHECGGRCDGMGDFMDIQMDPSGRPWAALVDVCNEKCEAAWATDKAGARHDANMGFVGTLATGPALTAEGGALAALPPVPAAPAS